MELRQFPDGPVIGYLSYREPLIVLYGIETVNGIVWIEVEDEDGRVGWIPQIFVITMTPTATSTIESAADILTPTP
jgi:hypothetical protein